MIDANSPDDAGSYPEPPPASPPPRRRRSSLGLWLFIFAVALMVLFAATFIAALSGIATPAPSVSRGSVISIDLAQSFTEDPLYAGGPFMDAQEVTFRDLLFGIRAAKDDARIDHLFLHVRGTSLGWANTFELHSQLMDFKSNGKPVIAFVEYAGNRDYLLASAADEIYLHPQAIVDVRGIRAELMFMKSTLEKLGVEAEFERFGAYKGGPEVFLREGLSDETREAISAVVDTLHQSIVEAIAEGRELTKDDVERLLAEGPFTADQARSLGLVDELKYIDEVRSGMSSDDDGEEPSFITVGNYRRAAGGGGTFTTRGKIAIVYGIGAIVGGGSADDAVFGRVMGSDTLAKAFETVREDDSIDAVVFRIDSPGGGAVASDVIWREARLTADEKPVIISMANVAASGGYWIATAADTIVAEPTTITGSIGIYGGKFNLAGLYEKLGLSHDGVSSTPNADFFSDNRSFTEEERARFRSIMESGYQAFLERVSKARGMTTEEVHEVARGRVWSGKDAYDRGLVDELGGLERAITLAKEKAGHQASDRFELVVYPEKKSVFEVLLSSLMQSRARTNLPLEMLQPGELLERSPLLESLMKAESHALMPFGLELN